MRHRLQMFFSLQLLFCMELQLVSFLLNEYVMLCYYGLLFFVLISLLPFVHGKQRRLDLWNLSLTFNLLKSTTACIVLCSPGIHCCSILIKFFFCRLQLKKAHRMTRRFTPIEPCLQCHALWAMLVCYAMRATYLWGDCSSNMTPPMLTGTSTGCAKSKPLLIYQ